MKNYLVKVLFNFDDMEEKNEQGMNTQRKKDEMFYCTKERFEYLNSKNAVMLIGIDKKKTSKK